MKKFGKKRLTIVCILSAVTLSLFVTVIATSAKDRELTFQNKKAGVIVDFKSLSKTALAQPVKVLETVKKVEAETAAAQAAIQEETLAQVEEDYEEPYEYVETEEFYGDDYTQTMSDTYNLGTGIYGFSSRDAYVLACCVSAEVGDQDYDCLLAVANVIIHRGISLGNCPGAIEEAVYQPYQFEVAYNSMQDFLAYGPQANAIAATQDALNGVDNVPGYKHFCYYTIMDDYLGCDGGMLLGSEWFYY